MDARIELLEVVDEVVGLHMATRDLKEIHLLYLGVLTFSLVN